ncbi:GNAT family N-acetyltransferase [candidate division WOR-3 bacterium]|nr:GNAT family N-acetyltransferase [candidate division WOR-3 bacterium]
MNKTMKMKSPEKDIENVVIKKLTTDDYDSMIELWDDVGLPYKPHGRDSRESIKYQLQQPTSIYLAAYIWNKMIGVICATHDGRKGWINRLAVLPNYQKRGIAKRLVSEVENRFYKLGIRIYACLIENWNTVSMEFFEHLGYKTYKDIFYLTKRIEPEI